MLDRLINSGDGGRPSYWAAAWRMFEDAPLTGLGPGAWAARRLAYLEPGEVDFSVPHAHNVYLQTAAELGVVGLAAGVIAGLAVGWLIYRALRSGDGLRTTLGLVGALRCDLPSRGQLRRLLRQPSGRADAVDHPAGHARRTYHEGIGVPRSLAVATTGRVASVLLAIACVGSIGVLGMAESSALTLDVATKAADEGDWLTASDAAASAAESDAHPGHDLMVALTAMQSEDWASAIEHYERSLEVDDLPHAWLGLALATMETGGSEDEVVGHLDRAMRMGRQDAAVVVAVADVYRRLGRPELAQDTMALAITQQPALAADPTIDAGAIDTAIDRAGTGGWRIALAAGDVERARRLAESAGASTVTMDIIDAWGGDTEAMARVQEAALANPDDRGLHSTAATLSDRAGESDQANRFRQLALYREEGISYVGLPLEVAESCEAGTWAPSRTELHGLWAYRRDLPRQLLPSGAACLSLAVENE